MFCTLIRVAIDYKVYKNNKEVCAKLEWTTGNNLGSATVGSREMPMSHLVLTGSCQGWIILFRLGVKLWRCESDSSARSFLSSDGLQFEWRRDQDTPSSYDVRLTPTFLSIHVLNSLQLYAGSDKPIAVFRRFPQPQPTAIGPAHGLFQYSFNRDNLLTESLVALCINRWIDLHMVPVYSVGF